MHRQDIALYSAMQTITLRQQLVTRRLSFRHESEFSAYIKAEFKRLKKVAAINAATFKYFNDVLAPGLAGFSQRWQHRFLRYAEIMTMVALHQDKTDQQRLGLFYAAMQQAGFACQVGHGDELRFDEPDSKKILQLGFIGMAQTELNKFVDDTIVEDTYLTYFLGEQYQQAELQFITTLQTYGFNFYFDASLNVDSLMTGAFGFVVVVSFANQLLGRPETGYYPLSKKLSA